MNEDEMLEESAKQAMEFGSKMQLDRTEREASNAGLSVNQMGSGDMNGGRSYSNAVATGPSDVQARELEENHRVVETRQQIISEGEMSMADLLYPDLSSPDPTTRANAQTLMRTSNAANSMANHMVSQGAQQVVHNAYMNPNEASDLMESEAYNPMQNNSGWQVTKKYARLKNGKQLPVFIVEDSLTGMNTGKKYRISSIAEKISAVLNATQNMDDPRIQMIDKSYDQHIRLMRSLNEAKRNGNRKKVSLIESKLQIVNTKLGLS